VTFFDAERLLYAERLASRHAPKPPKATNREAMPSGEAVGAPVESAHSGSSEHERGSPPQIKVKGSSDPQISMHRVPVSPSLGLERTGLAADSTQDLCTVQQRGPSQSSLRSARQWPSQDLEGRLRHVALQLAQANGETRVGAITAPGLTRYTRPSAAGPDHAQRLFQPADRADGGHGLLRLREMHGLGAR